MCCIIIIIMKKYNLKKTQIGIIIFFLFVIIGLIIRVFRLQNQPFYDWDEAIYAQVAKEIIKNRSLTTTFNNQIWFNKPPLSHFLISLTFIVFPNHKEISSRLIFVFFSFLTLLLTYKMAKKLFKNNFLAIFTPVLLLSSKIYLERSTILNTDIIIACSWLGYLYYLDSFWRKTFFLLIGVWSKSLVGFYPLLFDLFYFFIQKKYQNKKSLVKKISQLLFQIIIASSWYLYGFYQNGYFFIKAHFYDQIFKRVIKPIELHTNNLGFWYYPNLLWQEYKILIILLLTGLGIVLLKLLSFWQNKQTWFSSKKEYKRISYFLFPLPIMFFFFFIKSKIYWYLVFILPFLALIISYPLDLIKKNFLKNSIILVLFINGLTIFIKNTYFYHHQPEITEKFTLTQCISKLPFNNFAYLVHIDERNIYQFLKKNDLDTATSFIYGGSPAFVYYSNKNPKFFYQEDQFKNEYQNFPIIVIQKNDLLNLNLNLDSYQLACHTNNPLDHEQWNVFLKKD